MLGDSERCIVERIALRRAPISYGSVGDPLVLPARLSCSAAAVRSVWRRCGEMLKLLRLVTRTRMIALSGKMPLHHGDTETASYSDDHLAAIRLGPVHGRLTVTRTRCVAGRTSGVACRGYPRRRRPAVTVHYARVK